MISTWTSEQGAFRARAFLPLAACFVLLSLAAPAQTNRVFVFGAVADVQYAERDTQPPRRYREAPGRLASAVGDWAGDQPDFVVQLGDLIDGYPGNEPDSRRDFTNMLARFAPLSCPRIDVAGNHCLLAGHE